MAKNTFEGNCSRVGQETTRSGERLALRGLLTGIAKSTMTKIFEYLFYVVVLFYSQYPV
jgi:hypothetical protein